MKQLIPFTKDIELNTMIDEITNISFEHDITLNEKNNIRGEFFVSGTYKENKTSTSELDFSYKIPIDIEIDEKYNTDNIEIEIENFDYEITSSNKITLDIELCIDHLEEKEIELEEIETIDFNQVLSEDEQNNIKELITEINTKEEKEIVNELITEINTKEEKEIVNESKPSVKSLFEAFKDTEETFVTYSVYTFRENDNLEDIIKKYKTSKEELDEYNDLSNIHIGTKILIPKTIYEDN